MKNLTQIDYTLETVTYQLVLPLNVEILIPKHDSVRLLSQVMEELDYTNLYKAYSRKGRKPAVSPKKLFKIIVYGYINRIYTSRELEWVCQRDINFMWLLEGEKAPDHNTIACFRSEQVAGAAEDLFYQLVRLLKESKEISFKNLLSMEPK
jgi:transposase